MASIRPLFEQSVCNCFKVEYSADERSLMCGILREDYLNERKDRARKMQGTKQAPNKDEQGPRQTEEANLVSVFLICLNKTAHGLTVRLFKEETLLF